jgi:hypothetical protein
MQPNLCLAFWLTRKTNSSRWKSRAYELSYRGWKLLKKLLSEMSYGFMDTMSKHKLNHHNGSKEGDHDRKSETSAVKRWSRGDSFFPPILRGLFTMNFFHKARQWPRNNILKKLNFVRLSEKMSDAWSSNRWMLHTDNAPAHTSLLIRQFLAKHETIVDPQTRYSPDLAPVDFLYYSN